MASMSTRQIIYVSAQHAPTWTQLRAVLRYRPGLTISGAVADGIRLWLAWQEKHHPDAYHRGMDDVTSSRV